MATTKVTGSAGSAWSSAARLKRTSLVFPRLRDRGNLGVKDATARDHIRFHARLRAENARQMFGLRANNCGGCFVPMLGDPAAARHRAVTLSYKFTASRRIARLPCDFVECVESPCPERVSAISSYGASSFRDARNFSPPQTLRGTLLSVPLECCLLGCSDRYFFFAAFLAVFLAAFFAGFLAAFLVAICLFSLFDGLHRFCN